jgi:hypothetical protein
MTIASSYAKLVDFGRSAANDLPVYDADPLTYCIGNNASQRFNHGSNADTYGQNSNACQVFMSQRCAGKWDDVCEYAASPAANNEYATRADTLGAGNNQVIGLTPGDILLRNTALEKYRTNMHGCQLKVEPFNAINAHSPLISYYVGQNCVGEYEVLDPSAIDDDPVMNKLLDNPRIAVQLLTNIKNTMTRRGTLASLAGTRLGAFYGLGGGFGNLPRREPYVDGSRLRYSGAYGPEGRGVVDRAGYGVAVTPTPALLYDTFGAPPDPFATSVVPTIAGLTPVEYVDWWPTQYVDAWPASYDGAWLGSNFAIGGGRRIGGRAGYGAGGHGH